MTAGVGMSVLYILLQARLLRCLSCVTVALQVYVRTRLYEYECTSTRVDERMTLFIFYNLGQSSVYGPDEFVI